MTSCNYKTMIRKVSTIPRVLNGLLEKGDARGTTFGAYADYDHVVIVVGHAVVKIDGINRADSDENSWYLLPYQRDQGFLV